MYKLIKIKPTGMRVTLADSSDRDALISSGTKMQRDLPELQLSVLDYEGNTIWPMSA
jgi:hypothetical protein